jgi:deoxycytidylate deaminase
MPCDRCFVHVIQAGIKRVVFPEATPTQLNRWGEAFARVKALANEVDIQLVEYAEFI